MFRSLTVIFCIINCFISALSYASSPFDEPLERIAVIKAEHVVSVRLLGFNIQNGIENKNALDFELRTRANVYLYSDGLSFIYQGDFGKSAPLPFTSTPAAERKYDKWYKKDRGFYSAGTIFTVNNISNFILGHNIEIHFEACNIKMCLMPATFIFKIEPGSMGIPAEIDNNPSPTPPPQPATISTVPATTTVITQQTEPIIQPTIMPPPVLITTQTPKIINQNTLKNMESFLTQEVKKGGGLIFLWLFLAGIIVNLTPCVYPMIPITIGVLSRLRTSQNTKLSRLLPPIFYNLGIAISYSTMGLLAALGGQIFGSILQNNWVLIIISIIMFSLGLIMLGIFDISKLQTLGSKIPISNNPLPAAFGMGAVSALVSAPCTGPILASILIIVSQLQNPLTGFFMLFVFSLGFGFPYLIIGGFIDKIKLPRIGYFGEIIKIALAALMFALGLYYLRSFLQHLPIINLLYNSPTTLLTASVSTLLITLIFIRIALKKKHYFITLFTILALTILETWSTLWLLDSFANKEVSLITWTNNWETAKQSAKISNKFLLVDLWADWCVACKKMDENLWQNPSIVQEVNNNFIALKLDFTESSPMSKEFIKNWNLGGLPGVAIYPPNYNFNQMPPVLFRTEINGEEFFNALQQLKQR